MFGDAERPSRLRAEQDQALRAYVRRQVYPYSAFNRTRLSGAGIGPLGIRTAADLRRVPPVSWAEVGDGADLLLRPRRTTITRLGSAGLAFRVLFATLLGRRQNFERTVIEPVYRPILWLIQQGVPVGLTANDLDRLSEIGRRWLEASGVSRVDVVASVIPAGPHLDYWQLVAATRRAGVAAAFLEPDPEIEDVARIRPTVLAGRPADVLALAQRGIQTDPAAFGALRTVLLTGELTDDATRHAIQRQLSRKAVVLAAWAPPGVRAMWAECRGGQGFHTWPATEILEVLDPVTLEPTPPGAPGEIVWSALGWAGTVVLRLRTGVRASRHDTMCPACRRTTPRIVPLLTTPSVSTFAPILDAHPGVAAWQGELTRRNGSEELIVFLTPARPGHPGRLVRDLDRQLQPTQPAAQFVVLSADDLERRLADHGYNHVVDKR